MSFNIFFFFYSTYFSYLSLNDYFIIHLNFFVFFSFLICLFSTFLIIVNNPIYSVISLILVYLIASFLLVLIEVHFLAVLFILVYLGAVVVLFLFIVMMLNIKVMAPLSLVTFLPFFFILSFLFLFFFNIDIVCGFNNIFLRSLNLREVDSLTFLVYFPFTSLMFDVYNIEVLNYKFEHLNSLAFLLYTHYYIELLIASYVLLLAMVGCIALTLGKEIKGLKKQDTMQQILHSNSFLLRKVKRNKV